MASSNSSVRVRITKYGDRKFWIAYYDCPLSKKRVTRSTRETTEKAAERFAAKWEADLHEGRYKPDSKITWQEFRDRFDDEHLTDLRPTSIAAYSTALQAFENACNPKLLKEATSEKLTYFKRQLRGLATETIKTYLRQVKVALRWAYDQKMLQEMPSIKLGRRTKDAMKGRPITTEEFERMLDSVADQRREPANPKAKDRTRPACRPEVEASWRHFLEGLWLSGLRLNEALNLSWDDITMIQVDLDRKRPMLLIPAELDKGKQDRIHPMTPDFAEFLRQTPQAERSGYVFKPLGVNGRQVIRSLVTTSAVISEFGRAARVVVVKTGAKTKHATAHDLRRSFGERWSRKVMPVVLQRLMRHEDINTTMKYYVGHNAEAIADELWALSEPSGVAHS